MVLRAAACDRGRRARLERKIAQTLAAEAAAHDERAQREAARRKPFTAESMQALLAALADRNKT